MKYCIECDEPVRNEKSYLCENCFDEMISKKVEEEVVK